MTRLLSRLLPLLLLAVVPAASAAPRYVVQVDPAGAQVRVLIGTTLLRFSGGASQSRTVTDLLGVGSNYLRLGWNDVKRPATVSILRVDGKSAEVLFRYGIDGVLRPRKGGLNISVVRDDAPPSGITLGVLMNKGLARVSLNGHPLGDYASLERRDVGAHLRDGRNTLTVDWSKDFGASLPSGEVRLTHGRTVLARWRAGPSLSGTETIIFAFKRAGAVGRVASTRRAPPPAPRLEGRREAKKTRL